MKWEKEGLEEPECVKNATADYKQEMDVLAGFIDECLIIDYNCKDHLMARDLFQVYTKWAKENNEYEMSSKKFGMEMTKKLPEKGRSAQGIYYLDVKFSESAKRFKDYRIDDFH